MFDQILNMVKDHMSSSPNTNIPADKADAVHHEIATHVTNGLKNHATSSGGIGGLLSSLQGGIESGGPVAGAIEGGLVASLTSKLGLPPAISGAVATALPGLLQKFTHKVNDPNDQSITPESLHNDLLDKTDGGLGGIMDNFK